jgi:hypothetical protein
MWPLQAKKCQEVGNKQIHLKLSDFRVSNPGEINWSDKRLKKACGLQSIYQLHICLISQAQRSFFVLLMADRGFCS